MAQSFFDAFEVDLSALYSYRRNTDGSSRYTVTVPTGRSNVKQIGLDGVATTTLIDGTTIRDGLQPDPTFGMFSPLVTETVTAPNGLVRTRTPTRTTTVGQDGSAAMTETLNENGRISRRVFDPSSRTWTITSAENRTSRIVLDELARVVSTDSTGSIPITQSYDSRGRVDRIAQGTDRAQDFVYDPTSGYLASATNALDETTSYVTDSLGRTTSMISADESVTAFIYDGEGHLTTLVPPGRQAHQLGYSSVDLLDSYTAPQIGATPTHTQTLYDLDRRPVTVTQADGLQQTFAYHPTTGLQTSETIPGDGTTTLGYDMQDRMTSMTLPNGGSVVFGYSGRLVTSVTVNGPHRVMDGATTVWSGNLSGSTHVVYDPAFHVKSLEVRGAVGAPAGFAAQYVRDQDDMVTSVSPLVAGTGVSALALTRSPLDGHLMATTQGVVTTTHETDRDVATPGYGELERLSAAVSGSEVLSVEYERDDLGRIVRIDELVEGTARTRQYEYDLRGRLTGVRDGAGAMVSEYAYDANGARTRLAPGLRPRISRWSSERTSVAAPV